MDEIRKNQVVGLLRNLNEMCWNDYDHTYARFVYEGDTISIETSSRIDRIALEMLLSKFQKMTVYNDGNCKLEIKFY